MKKYITKEFKIRQHDSGELIPVTPLNSKDKTALHQNNVIYIYDGPKHVYVGQTKHFYKRSKQHAANDKGSFIDGGFKKVIAVYGQLVTGDSLDDIESKLITYMHADKENKHVLIENGTMGNYSPRYGQEAEVNSDLIAPLWQELYSKKYVINPKLRKIKNSILYKYSPFKDLSLEQYKILNEITLHPHNSIINGLAGTGKTVLLTNLAARLSQKYSSAKIAVVVKPNWKKNAQNIFKSYNAKNITVTTPFSICNNKTQYNFIIVDEAHRLTRYYPKGNNLMQKIFKDEHGQYSDKYTELDFILKLAKQATILLYDPSQAIRPNDIPKERYQEIIKKHNFTQYDLNKEYRINIKSEDYTSKDYINGIRSFLQLDTQKFNPAVFRSYLTTGDDAYFGIVDSIQDLFDYTNRMRNYDPSSVNRVVAGYSRPWVSKPKKDKKTGKNVNAGKFDWVEGNHHWKWNDTQENWAYRDTENQIGSIHAIQGVDLNYVGVIISTDIDIVDGKIVGVEENYQDSMGKFVKDNPNQEAFNTFIKDIYYVLLTRGIDGIRVYFENKRLEQYFKKLMGI